jgi:hypothetical protein
MPHQGTMVRFLTDLLDKRPTLVDGVYLWTNPEVRAPRTPART